MVNYKTYIENGKTFDVGVTRVLNLDVDIGQDRNNVTIICDKGSFDIYLQFDETNLFEDVIPIEKDESFSFSKVQKVKIVSTKKDTKYRIIGGTASGLL